MAKLVGVDKWMFFTTLLLVVAGLVMVFSASAVVAQERYNSPYTFVGKQAIWALAGVLVMLVLMHVDYTVYNSPRFIYPALCVTTLLLVLVFLFPSSHNTHRWIHLGPFTLQPSELAKPTLILFLAWFLSTRLDLMRDWKHTLLRAAVMPVVFILLIVKQPDLGTALVLCGVTAMMLLLAGMEWKYLGFGVLAALPGLAALAVYGRVASPAHACLSQSGIRPARRRLPHQSVAHRRGHWRPHRSRLHGGRAETLLSA
jgi:cell division protein FtsW